jgi:tetratricopeptide (TPR) repeat protein
LLRAIRLGPNLAGGHYVYSHWYLTQKLYEEAITEANLALDIDPLSVHLHYHLGAICYFSREYDQAIERLGETCELDPLFVHAHQLLARAYARKGMQDNAMAEVEKGLDLAKNDLRGKAFSGMVSALMGKSIEARKILGQLAQESGPPNFSSAYQCALLHALLGDTDEALACLDKARKGRAVALAYVAATPEVESLRDDPRFSDLLHRVGIPVSRI